MTESAGYSGTPLGRKLGIRAGSTTVLLGAPKELSLGTLEPGAVVLREKSAAGRTRFDVALLFCPDRAALVAGFEQLRDRMEPTSALWACWPKKASKVETDLDENQVRSHGLAAGLVDVKIAAVDPTWSALKFVYRVVDRPSVARTRSGAPRTSSTQA